MCVSRYFELAFNVQNVCVKFVLSLPILLSIYFPMVVYKAVVFVIIIMLNWLLNFLQYKVRAYIQLKSLKACKREIKSVMNTAGNVSVQNHCVI